MISSASSDEGEIRDGVMEKKATTSLRTFGGTSVDRQDRTRSSTTSISPRSPDQSYRSRDQRSRSPYSHRHSRGSKRPRDDDYSDRSRNDPRCFKVHYEDSSQDYRRRPQVSYEDIDKGSVASSELRYDDHDHRDGYSEKRTRTRSRSPYRASRDGDKSGRNGQAMNNGGRYGDYTDRSKSYGYGGSYRNSRDQSVSNRDKGPLPADNSRHEAKTTQGHLQQHSYQANGSEIEMYACYLTPHVKDLLTQFRSTLAEETSTEAPEEEQLDEATLIEQRRKRREAIKAKYRGSGTPLLVQALHLGDKSGASTPGQGEDSPSGPTSKHHIIQYKKIL